MPIGDEDGEEPLPEDIDDLDLYLPGPMPHDLELGRNLLLEFVEANLPRDADLVHGFFRRRGAYGNTKDLLQRRGLLDAWYAHEQAATFAALRQWAQENDLIIAGERSSMTVLDKVRHADQMPQTVGGSYCRRAST